MAPPAPAPKTTASANSFAALSFPVKVGLALFIPFAVGAVYKVAFRDPLAEEMESARSQYQTLQTSLTQARSREQRFLELQTAVNERQGLDRANLRVLPAQAEIPAFLQDLNRLAEMSGLRIRLVEPRAEEPSENYVKLPVALRLTGRFHQLSRFFYNVSRLERVIAMENIHLEEPRFEGEDVLLSVDVLATTFRQPDAPASAQPPAAAAPRG